MPTAQSPRTATSTEVASVLSPANGTLKRRFFQNLSPTDSCFFGAADVTASGAKQGWEVKPGIIWEDKISNGLIYTICAATKTCSVKVWEVTGS